MRSQKQTINDIVLSYESGIVYYSLSITKIDSWTTVQWKCIQTFMMMKKAEHNTSYICNIANQSYCNFAYMTMYALIVRPH